MWLTTQMHTAQCAHHTHTVCTPHTCHKHVPHTLYAHSCTQLLHVPHTRRILHAHLLLACRMAASHPFCQIVDSLLLVLMLLPTANGLPHFRPTDHANLYSVRKPTGQKSIGESLFACFCEPLQPAPTPISGPHPAPHIQGRQPYGQSATDRFRPPGRRSIQVPFLHQRSGEFLCDLLVNILFP